MYFMIYINYYLLSLLHKIYVMKNLIIVIALCFSYSLIGQEKVRQEIEGLIIVEGNEIEGITIYNASSEKGTVSDANGAFKINVALNDLIEIRAIEYENFNVVINETILTTKELHIYLIEEVNVLDEVLVSNKSLTGNMASDIKNIKTFIPKTNALYFAVTYDKDYTGIDTGGAANNAIQHSQAQSMVNGLNVVNVVDQLLLPLFRSEVKDKQKVGIADVPPRAIKYYFGANFLKENFNIPEYRVEEFIRYVETEKDFDFDLLNYGRELEFLELLNQKSISFLK